MTRYAKSKEWYDKAREIIPWGTQTGAKWPDLFGGLKNHMPFYVERAKGARFRDIDGNDFIDYRAALGPIILGYADDEVDEAVREEMAKGILFSMASPVEYEAAKLLTEVIPCAEMVRFLKTGADATSACVRLARAYTGKEKILSCGYHGWQDTFCSAVNVDRRGVPKAVQKLVLEFKYNDLDGANELAAANRGEIAALIVNPFGGRELPAEGFLEGLRELAVKDGIVLIFDEIKTGFRLALGGAQEFFGVKPDLAAFSKAMANGYPLSAFAGSKDIMGILEDRNPEKPNANISTTFAGETMSLAALCATIGILRKPGTYEKMYRIGQLLMDGLKQLAAEHGIPVTVQGVGTWFSASLDCELKNSGSANQLFYRGLLERGVFCVGDWHLTLSHGNREVEETLRASAAALKDVKNELA